MILYLFSWYILFMRKKKLLRSSKTWRLVAVIQFLRIFSNALVFERIIHLKLRNETDIWEVSYIKIGSHVTVLTDTENIFWTKIFVITVPKKVSMIVLSYLSRLSLETDTAICRGRKNNSSIAIFELCFRQSGSWLSFLR